jgi:hypothetical protein
MATYLRRALGNMVKKDDTPASLTLSRPEVRCGCSALIF